MANVPGDVVFFERLIEKARKDIGENIDFLESFTVTLFTPLDIWTRHLRELDGLDDFDRRLLELDGRGPTEIVTAGLPNACTIY